MSIGEGRLPFIFYRFFTLPLWVPIWLTLYLEYHPNVEYIFLLDAPFSVLTGKTLGALTQSHHLSSTAHTAPSSRTQYISCPQCHRIGSTVPHREVPV
jgi:hypothetical protein